MNQEQYLDELRERLFSRGAPPDQAQEIVAEVESHLAVSGEDPVDAFGLPDRYAASVLPGRWGEDAWPMLLTAILAGLGGWLAALAVTELAISGGPVKVGVAHVLVVAVLVAALLTIFSPAVAHRLPRTLTRLLVALAVVAVGGLATGLIGLTPAGEWTLVSVELPAALAVGLGLLAASALLSLRRRLKRR